MHHNEPPSSFLVLSALHSHLTGTAVDRKSTARPHTCWHHLHHVDCFYAGTDVLHNQSRAVQSWLCNHGCAQPITCCAETECSARLRLQQAELTWSMDVQRLEGRLTDAVEARGKLEQQVAALTQVNWGELGGS